MNRIYMDYASTTPVDLEVAKVLKAHYEAPIDEKHEKALVERAKRTLKEMLNADLSSAIYFTATGTEANQAAIETLLKASGFEDPHLIVSSIEHPSVLRYAEAFEKAGGDVSYAPVTAEGYVAIEALKGLLKPTTAVVSMMLVNNEVGTVQPIEAVCELLKSRGVPLHVDAIQALGKIPIDVTRLDVDAMTFSAHKVYAPKGLGAIYMKAPNTYCPIVTPYTDNVPYIAAFESALMRFKPDCRTEMRRKKKALIEGLVNLDKGIRPIGDVDGDIGIVTFYFEGKTSDGLLINYDWKGVALSAGSACSSGAISASHVLRAMGLSEAEAKRCVRFSIGTPTTDEAIQHVVEATRAIMKG